MLEPHGAVGWAGLRHFLETYPEAANLTAISLETAHPAKFPDEIRVITGRDPPLPPSLQGLDSKPEQFVEMATEYDEFKAYLLKEYRS